MMLKNVIRDVKYIIKHENPLTKSCMLSFCIVFLVASIKSGDVYRFIFLVYSAIGYILGTAMAVSGEVCEYMLPFSDAERKKYHITKCAFFSVTATGLLLAGSMCAVFFGRQSQVRENLLLVFLMHIIGCILIFNLGLEVGTEGREEKSVIWRLADGISYGATGIYMVLAVSLFRENFKDSLMGDFGTKGTLLVCLITIALLGVQMRYYLTKKMNYEYVSTEKRKA